MTYRVSPGRLAFIIVCFVGVLTSGCARMGALSRVDPLSVAVYPGGGSTRDNRDQAATGASDCPMVRGANSFSRGAINLNCFMFPEDRPRAGIAASPTTLQLAYARAAIGKPERNRLAALLLKHSDDVCVEEMGRLNSNESAVNTTLSILATAFTTTANIVTGDLAQSILTGGGTLAGASRSHVNAYVYRNTFAYAISRAITIERGRLRAALEKRFDDSIGVFSVDQAIQAVNEYHGVCSFYKGLELVLASVEGDQRSRDAQARQARINELQLQIARQWAALAGPPALAGDARKPFLDRIEALEAEVQAEVVGAGQPPEEENEEADEPVTNAIGNTSGAGG